MTSIISGILGAIVAAAIYEYFSNKSAKGVAKGNLKYGVFLKSCSFLLLAVTSGLAYMLFYVDHGGQYVPLSILIFFSGLLTCSLFLAAFRTHAVFDDLKISYYGPVVGDITEAWESLESVESKPKYNCYVLKFNNGSEITITPLLLGHGHLNDFLKSIGYEF